MNIARIIESFTGGAPLTIWGIAAVETVILAFAVRLAIKRKQPTTKTTNRTARILLLAAMVFCSVVLAAFVIGTYEGSTAFAKDRLGWTDWRQIIPWGALDAAGFGFGLFVVRAVVLDRNPVRARRVVYLCAGFSALLQMLQGGQHHRWQAGLFLAFIAAMGAMVLHTVVDQLRDGVQDESAWHRKPPFGLRWITWPTNTFAAWLCWTNHPAPADLARPTVANAIDNLERVRAARVERAADRFAADLSFPRLSAITPWRRAPIFAAAIGSLRSEHAEQIAKLIAEQASLAERADTLAVELDRTRAEIGEQIHAAVLAAREQTERTIREQVARETRQRAEQDRAVGHRPPRTERAEQPREQRKPPEQVARLRADEQITDDLWKSYREQMEQIGAPLSTYRVRVDGNCAQRQADRVLDLLARRWEQHRAGGSDSTAEQAASDPEQTEQDPTRPLDREPVEASA